MMVFDCKGVYVFVPGKNWRLSLADLIAYFEARRLKIILHEFGQMFFTVRADKDLAGSVVDGLGGTLKMGRAVACFSRREMRDAFLLEDKEALGRVKMDIVSSGVVDDMASASSRKVVFGVSVYCADESFRRVSGSVQRFVGSTLKHELRARGRTSGFMGFSRKRRQPQLTHVEVLKKDLVEKKAEMLLCIGARETVMSVTMGVHNPFQFQKRDMERPVQRRIFSVPPRIARTLVNLASCTSGKVLLDPFCGVGTILQEGLLSDARVIGLDVNPWCVKASQTNLGWLKTEYSLEKAEYTVLQGDSRRLSETIHEEVDCIATEPDLGPALRQVATIPYAKKIIEKLTPLYDHFLEEAYKTLKKSGRLALVTPYVRTRSGKPVTMSIREKAGRVGFKTISPFPTEVIAGSEAAYENLTSMTSLVDLGERHKIGREISVFEK